jgi:hypothetical protein
MSRRAPELIDIGNGVCVRWPDHDLRILLEYPKKQNNGVTSEVTVIRGDITLCESSRINLNTEATTHTISKKMVEADHQIPNGTWFRIMETTCVLVLRHIRTGEPPIRLITGADLPPRPFRLNPVVYDKLPSILYGTGGIGKSYLATLSCLLVQSGHSIAGLAGLQGSAAYFDWESDHHDLQNRTNRIRRAHPGLDKAEPLYLRCYAPLKEELPRIQRIVAEHQITYAVVDSIAPACGGELEKPETVMDLFRCLRRLNIAVLLIGHPPRSNDPNKETDVFGSTFFRYNVRTLWEMKGTESGERSIAAGLFHRKINLGPKHVPIGLQIDFDDFATRFSSMELTDEPDLAIGLPLPSRIRNLLETDASMWTAEEIAQELGAKLKTVSDTLTRHKGIKWQKIGENRESRWTVLHSRHGLPTRRDSLHSLQNEATP